MGVVILNDDGWLDGGEKRRKPRDIPSVTMTVGG